MVQLENNQVKSLKLNYIKLRDAWNHFDCISPVKHLIIIISNHDIKITGDSKSLEEGKWKQSAETQLSPVLLYWASC